MGQLREFADGVADPTMIPDTMAITAFSIALVVWTYALARAAAGRSPAVLKHPLLHVLPIVAILSEVILAPIGHALYRWEGEPPGALSTADSALSIVAGFAAIGLAWIAAYNLKALEAPRRSPRFFETLLVWIAIVLLGVGIWFIHGRVKAALALRRNAAAGLG